MRRLYRKTIFLRERQERGAALVLAMVFMTIVTLIIVPMLAFSAIGIKTGITYNNKADTLYSADSGIEDAKWQIKYDQLSGKFSTYDPHDYTSTWTYALPQANGKPEINNKNVNVTIQNDWIPKNIPAPDKATANAIINNSKLMVTGGSYSATSYNVVITYYPGPNESLKVNTVGIWLPPGYAYAGNNNVGSLGTLATAGYQGGQSVIWNFNALNFTSLPGVSLTDTPMTAKITFDYSPSTSLTSGASAGSSSLHVASTTGFPSAGSISLPNESLPVTYTGTTANTITGIPASGNGAITASHSSGESVGLGTKPDAVSWVDTGNSVSGLSYTWDDTVRVFHMSSIGSNTCTTLTGPASIGSTTLNVASTTGFPSTGSLTLPFEKESVTYSGKTTTSFTGIPHSGTGSIFHAHITGEAVAMGATSVETYMAKSELRKIGGELNGDYYATGNSLMRDLNSDGVKETKVNSSAVVAAPNPSGADNGVPDDANVSASFLYWGTWYMSDNWASQNNIGSGSYSQRCHTLFTDTCSVFYGGPVLNYNGSNWSPVTCGTNNTLYGVWGSSSSNIFAVGLNGTILKYGTSWSSMTSGTTNTLYSVWGSSASNVFAVGLNGTVLKYNGTNWSSMTSGTTNTLYGVWGSSGTNVFAVGLNGTILKYNGTSWSSMTSGTTNTLYSVWGSSSSLAFAVGLNGTILKYNGTSWSSMTSGTTNSLASVWGNSSSLAFAVGLNGTILKYNGTSWSSMTSGTTNTLYSVWGSSGTNVFAVGLNGTILNYNGTSWSSMTSGTTNTLYCVWGSSSSNVFAMGFGGNADNGTDWSVYNSSYFLATGNNDADGSTNRDFTEHSSFAFDLGTYPSPTWIFTLSWEQWYSGTAPSSTDGLDFSISNDGGATWSNRIRAFRGSGVGTSQTSVFSTYQYNIPVTYLTSTFKIKFHAVGFNISNQYVNVDDIRINALNPDTGITFEINNGSGNKIVYFDSSGNPATSTHTTDQVISNRTQVILTYSFSGSNPVFSGFAESCFRDVTALVTTYAHQPVSPATNFNGHATYTAIGDLGDTGTNTSAYQLAHAGWSLVTVYTGAETLGHQLYLYDNFFGSGNVSSGGIHVVWNGDGSSGGTIKGFVVPQQIPGEVNASKLTCFVTEGDNQLTGDYLAVNGTRLWDGTNSTSNSKSSPNNVWNATSYLSGGYSIYDGVDIDTLGIDPTANPPQYITWQSQILKPGDTLADIDLYTQQDYWFMVYMIISFRSETTTGSSLNYLIHG